MGKLRKSSILLFILFFQQAHAKIFVKSAYDFKINRKVNEIRQSSKHLNYIYEELDTSDDVQLTVLLIAPDSFDLIYKNVIDSDAEAIYLEKTSKLIDDSIQTASYFAEHALSDKGKLLAFNHKKYLQNGKDNGHAFILYPVLTGFKGSRFGHELFHAYQDMHNLFTDKIDDDILKLELEAYFFELIYLTDAVTNQNSPYKRLSTLKKYFDGEITQIEYHENSETEYFKNIWQLLDPENKYMLHLPCIEEVSISDFWLLKQVIEKSS